MKPPLINEPMAMPRIPEASSKTI